MCIYICLWEREQKRGHREFAVFWVSSDVNRETSATKKYMKRSRQHLAKALAVSNNCDLSLGSITTTTTIHQIGVCTPHSMRFTTYLRPTTTATTMFYLRFVVVFVAVTLHCFLLCFVNMVATIESVSRLFDNERVSRKWFIYEFISHR